jgi:N-acetyl-1-D-myo-inositol-2-amino-2-deoxy-alpha-D-glucopyranoside deacetylase
MDDVRRALFVHAHPDDESITTGATIATLIDRGTAVTVLTCTRGELGEVIPADLAALAGDHAALGEERERELAAAMDALGVTDQRFLGDANARWSGRTPRRYLDSGMVWGTHGAEATAEIDGASLTAAEFGEVAADIAAVILDVRPEVVVSYNEWGGYGHPDHIRAHQAARRAAEVYGIPFYVIEPPDSASEITFSVDVAPVLERKRAALAAHRTQVVVDGADFALSNSVRNPIAGVESFRRLHREYPPGPTPFREQTLGIKVVTSIVAGVAGLYIGAMFTVVNQPLSKIVIPALPAIPVGVILAILVIAALLTGLRLVFDSRVVAAFAAVGILISLVALSQESPGGSVLVPANPAGYAWSIVPSVVAAIVLAWPRLPRRSKAKIEASPK